MGKIFKPILLIRDVMKKLEYNPETQKPPKHVILRFLHFIEDLEDPRVDGMIVYPLKHIVFIAFMAVLSGAATWVDIGLFAEIKVRYIKKFLHGYKRAPSHDTFRRVMGLINPELLSGAVSEFLLENLSAMKKALNIKDEDEDYRLISVDGKEARSTGRKYKSSKKIPNLQTLHVYDVSNAVCLASIPISEKTNEIPVAQKFLAEMQLKKSIVTFDALNTQKETIRVIVAGGGGYVGGLKGNHETFFEEVALYFDDEKLESIRKKKTNYYTTAEKAHNRIEKRYYYISTDINWFADKDKWANLRSFICYDIETEDFVTGKKTKERRYYISSMKDVKLCAEAIRGHWGVENQLHWHLDVNFFEDDNTTMDKNAFNNLSILNKMALTIYKLVKPALKRYSIRTIRQAFTLDGELMLTKILCFLDEDILAGMLQNVK